jgi:hypothetical protein
MIKNITIEVFQKRKINLKIKILNCEQIDHVI